MKKLCMWLLLLALPVWAEQRSATLAYHYDADSTTLTYCRMVGRGGSSFGAPIPGPAAIKTTGSSTSVTAVTAGTSPFVAVAVGDVIFISQASAGPPAQRYVQARADADNITVDVAVDAGTSATFSYLTLQCGTAATSGWLAVEDFDDKSFTLQYDQGDLDNLSIRLECIGSYPGATPNVVYPGESDTCGGGSLASGFCDFATAGITARLTVELYGPTSSCRVGFKVKTTDTSDAGANVESVTIGFEGAVRR